MIGKTAYNSGHAVLLRYAQISQRKISYVCKSVGVIEPRQAYEKKSSKLKCK